MSVRRMQVNDRSTLGAGLPNDFRDVVAQYLWNAFEAKASRVEITCDTTGPIDNINSFMISDNGTGIDYDSLDENFGFFLDSPKHRSKNSSLIHGGKGKGRLSFQLFSGKALWHTVYQDKDSGLKEYTITIKKDSKEDYDPSDPTDSIKQTTGTVLEFNEIDKITRSTLESEDLKHYLKLKFGWYLHLNKDKNYAIFINGEELEYKSIIRESKKTAKSFEDEESKKNHSFTIDYIQWSEKIGDQNYYYFLNSNQDEIFKDFTSFNKTGGGAYGFYHGVYVTSKFFDNFDAQSEVGIQSSLLATCKSNSAYKALLKYLKDDLLKKRKEFYKEDADKVWQGFEDRKTLPSYGDGEIQKIKKDSLKQVVESLYTIEPTIFISLKPEQEKTMLGLIDLVLDSDEKENVMKIVDSVVNDLSKEEREEFAELLKKIKLSNINDVLRLVVSREKIIERLKKLVFELKKFTNERDHIQKAVETSTWLFGEEFTTVSHDQDFETSLLNYTYILDGYSEKEILADPAKKRRVDIFLCRQKLINDPNYGNTSQLEENIIIELKRPDVNLGTVQMRQVQDYRNIIKKNQQFHSQMKIWKFFLVGNNVNDDVKAAYTSFQDKGKRFLIDWQADFEIYALTWSDIFDIYKIRNSFLLNKLNIDKTALKEELDIRQVELSKELSDSLTQLVSEDSRVAA